MRVKEFALFKHGKHHRHALIALPERSVLATLGWDTGCLDDDLRVPGDSYGAGGVLG
jgi:hypothetical protein